MDLTAFYTQLPCHVNLPEEWQEEYSFRDLAGPGDQRRFRRMEVRALAAIHPEPGKGGIQQAGWERIYLRDISSGGVAFIHSQSLEVGRHVVLLLPIEQLSRGVRVRSVNIVEITRCEEVNDQCFLVGGRFIKDV